MAAIGGGGGIIASPIQSTDGSYSITVKLFSANSPNGESGFVRPVSNYAGGPMIVMPDGQHLLYVSSNGHLMYDSLSDNTSSGVVDMGIPTSTAFISSNPTLTNITSISVPSAGNFVVLSGTGSDNGQKQIWKIDAIGTCPLASGSDAAVSPDGSQVAYTSENRLCVFTLSPYYHSYSVYNISNPQNINWSPDGSQISFVQGAAGHYEIGTVLSTDLAQHTSNPDLPVPIHTHFPYDGYAGSTVNPQWSPDGSKLLFYHDSLYSGGEGLYSANPDGTDQQLISAGWLWKDFKCSSAVTMATATASGYHFVGAPNLPPALWGDGAVALNIDLSSASSYFQEVNNGYLLDLVGGQGNDTLHGGNTRTNEIWGGAGGDDTLISGSKGAMFYWGKNDGNDVIAASQYNAISALYFYDALPSACQLSQNGNDLIISNGGTGTLTLQGWCDPANANTRILHGVFGDGTTF